MKKARSFAANLIRLPRLDANNAHSLGTAVLSASDAQGQIPDGVREARDEVATALELLAKALTDKLPAPSVSSGQRAKDADTQLDAAWSATFYWLKGWGKLRDERLGKLALELRARLFPDGLKFIQFKYPRQWAESNIRLDLVEQAGLDQRFDELGGRLLLTKLREAHRVYGDELGITRARDEETIRTAQVRDALDQLTDALRDYVLQVTAMVRKSDPKSTAIAGKLLAPIENWGTPPVRKGGGAPVVTEEGERASCGETGSE